MQSLGGEGSAWRQGTEGGPFTVDGGGSAGASSTAGPAAVPFAMQQQAGPNPYLAMLSASFPQQPSAEWANQAALAQSYSGAPSPLAYPTFSSPQGFPQSMPANNYASSFAHLAASGQPMDPNLLALHMSLEAQAGQYRFAASGSPLASSSMPAPPLPSSTRGIGSPPSSGPLRSSSSRKSGSSFVNAARGAVSGSGGVTPRQRQPTVPSQPGSAHNSPLPSPSIHPAHVYGDPASYFPISHQRPVPPLPRGMNLNTNVGSAHSSAHPSPLGSPNPSHVRSPSTSSSGLINPLNPFAPPPSTSNAASPASPHVDYDFSSLESDLDRFSSGGFASAAAAAMASVGPGQRSHKGVGGFGVGGYGSPSFGAGGENAPSPKVLAEVLGESFTASLPPRSPGPSNMASPIDFSAFVAESPAGSATSGSAARGAGSSSTKPSPSDHNSPTGSTIIDEESAEALSKKDPIAAQVWRMFNKAKNTMPNGARMENLTWRLMSMTLKKRREEAMSAEANSAAEVEASYKSAMEQEVKADAKRKEEEAAKEEARDNVQELRSRSDSIRGKVTPTSASTSTSVAAPIEEDEEDRGRRRRAGGATTPKSVAPSPEAAAEDDAMDWRAKSQSRSRSRAPDTMDWRAQSRSRSRAPDFRVAVAPPAVDAATATANFSRFYGDGSGSSTPAGSNSGSNSGSTSAAPNAQDSRSAHIQLAASLGLSPNAVDSYGSLNGFDQSSMSSFAASTASQPPSSYSSVTSPATSALPLSGAVSPGGSYHAYSTSRGSSYHNSYVGSPLSYPGPADSSTTNGADPNLAAIENTLNQLINLQSMASNGQGPSPSNKSGASFVNPSASRHPVKSPPNDHSFMPPPQSRKSTSDAYAPLAQQQLQQLARHSRKPSYTSSPSAATSPAASSSNAYMNAASLAQSTRPFTFNTGPSPNASGISLGRPPTLTDVNTAGPLSPAAFFSQPVSPYAYASSAPGPGHAFVGSPAASLYGDPSSADPNQAMYDYFAHQSQPQSGYTSPFLPSTSFDNSAPTHVDPSQLLAHLQRHTSLYESEKSPASRNSSSRTGSPSPPDGQPGSKPLMKSSAEASKARSKPTNMRISASSPDLVALGQAAKGKTSSAPGSRVHSRSNTISMPPTVPEGQVVVTEPAPAPSAPDASAPSTSKATRDSPGDDNLTRCLNCSTTNTPLWRRDGEGRPLCNACGLFRNLHGVDRPANLNTGVIKKRNRARGKEGVPKKSSSSSRAAARRNSLGGAGGDAASTVRATPRAGAPYPSTAARTNSSNNVLSATVSAATSPSA